MAEMISVAEARARILADVPLTGPEWVPLAEAAGRVLAADVFARRTQPPFDVSAMDGYAVRSADIATPPATLGLVGDIPAGRSLANWIAPGEAARIFTGAPMPPGADTVVIQEDTRAEDGRVVTLVAEPPGRHVRRKGLDFTEGEAVLTARTRLSPAALGLAASANHTELQVARHPRVGVIATGDELVPPGRTPGQYQIVASNFPAIAAVVARAGGVAIDFGIVRDDLDLLSMRIADAEDAGLDILVTVGGASVGEHDLVRRALEMAGMSLDFWKIAMRPGKPLMSGRLRHLRVLGLPGNPVSSLVCSLLFLAPLVVAMTGAAEGAPTGEPARLAVAVPANGPREDYMRARVTGRGDDGLPLVAPFDMQDSSMLTVLARADALLVRPPGAPPAAPDTICRIIRI